MKKMRILVNDSMQKGYSYTIQKPEGREFDEGFSPQLTPQEMLKLGVFEGKYLTDCQKEFPKEWFKEAKLSPYIADVSCNFFGVKSRLSLSIWQAKGWIYEPDVRGWFQWYCRYYLGRRLPQIDAIQIKRWRLFSRHLRQIEKNCPPADLMCRKRQRQALLQWGYSPFI